MLEEPAVEDETAQAWRCSSRSGRVKHLPEDPCRCDEYGEQCCKPEEGRQVQVPGAPPKRRRRRSHQAKYRNIPLDEPPSSSSSGSAPPTPAEGITTPRESALDQRQSAEHRLEADPGSEPPRRRTCRLRGPQPTQYQRPQCQRCKQNGPTDASVARGASYLWAQAAVCTRNCPSQYALRACIGNPNRTPWFRTAVKAAQGAPLKWPSRLVTRSPRASSAEPASAASMWPADFHRSWMTRSKSPP